MADIIVEATQRKQWELPKEGMHQAVLAEVNDLGLQTVTYKGESKQVHQVQFIWQTEEKDSDGKRKLLFERFTKSLAEKANLRGRIRDMFGKEPPLTLNLSNLVGSNVQVLVVHVTGKSDPSKTYANIKAILKHDASKPKIEAIPIERKKKDEAKVSPAIAGTSVTEENPITDNDLPW